MTNMPPVCQARWTAAERERSPEGPAYGPESGAFATLGTRVEQCRSRRGGFFPFLLDDGSETR
jgi:hypothetical protein